MWEVLFSSYLSQARPGPRLLAQHAAGRPGPLPALVAVLTQLIEGDGGRRLSKVSFRGLKAQVSASEAAPSGILGPRPCGTWPRAPRPCRRWPEMDSR